MAGGRAEALRVLASGSLRGVRALADPVRELALQAHLGLPAAVTVLLEGAWALAVGLDGSSASRTGP